MASGLTCKDAIVIEDSPPPSPPAGGAAKRLKLPPAKPETKDFGMDFGPFDKITRHDSLARIGRFQASPKLEVRLANSVATQVKPVDIPKGLSTWERGHARSPATFRMARPPQDTKPQYSVFVKVTNPFSEVSKYHFKKVYGACDWASDDFLLQVFANHPKRSELKQLQSSQEQPLTCVGGFPVKHVEPGQPNQLAFILKQDHADGYRYYAMYPTPKMGDFQKGDMLLLPLSREESFRFSRLTDHNIAYMARFGEAVEVA